jgi:hypothetical protein
MERGMHQVTQAAGGNPWSLFKEMQFLEDYTEETLKDKLNEFFNTEVRTRIQPEGRTALEILSGDVPDWARIPYEILTLTSPDIPGLDIMKRYRDEAVGRIKETVTGEPFNYFADVSAKSPELKLLAKVWPDVFGPEVLEASRANSQSFSDWLMSLRTLVGLLGGAGIAKQGLSSALKSEGTRKALKWLAQYALTVGLPGVALWNRLNEIAGAVGTQQPEVSVVVNEHDGSGRVPQEPETPTPIEVPEYEDTSREDQPWAPPDNQAEPVNMEFIRLANDLRNQNRDLTSVITDLTKSLAMGATYGAVRADMASEESRGGGHQLGTGGSGIFDKYQPWYKLRRHKEDDDEEETVW